MSSQSKALTITGWVITGLVAAMLTLSATMKFVQPAGMGEQFEGKFGYPMSLAGTLGVVEMSCVVLYLFPRTAVLGAVLLTGYLGGATATHVRVEDSFIAPVLVGVFAWLGIYLRDPRLRVLLPWRELPMDLPPK